MAPDDEYRLSPRLPGRAPRRAGRTALLVSLALHLLIALAWRIEVRLSPPDRQAPPTFVLIPDPAGIDRAVPPFATGDGVVPAPPDLVPPRNIPDHNVPRQADEPPGQVAGPPAAPPRGGPPAAAGDTGARRGGRPARLAPQYGDGRLWVEPYPETPSELADRVRRSHGQLVDSAVTAIVQAYLDSLAQEPGADRAQLPSWVTDVGGRKYGLDAKYIYVAGLKIPSAVLALIPFPQGNVDQALANRRLQDLRADLFQAAQRAENAAEFKKAIRDIRERKEQEEEFERNRRTAPGEDGTP